MTNTAENKDISPDDPGQDAPLPTSPQELLAKLEALGIPYKLYEHEAVFTVAESDHVNAKIPGMHCRNLFLRDKKKQMFLVSAQNDTQIDLKKLPDLLGCGRLSFGSADRLWQYLGVRPGSVCPYAVVNDTAHDVTLVLDASMMGQQQVNFHPLVNTMTIGTTAEDIEKFAEAIGHKVIVMDLSAAAPDEAAAGA